MNCYRICAGALLVALALAASGLVLVQAEPPEERGEWRVPRRHARKRNPVEATAESVARGKVIYLKDCKSCHGESGRGDGASAGELDVKPPDLSSPDTWKQTDGALFYKTRKGRSPMPAFKNELTETQVWDLVNYLRTLAPRPEVPGGGD